jgi:hypothetical protein
MKSTSEHKNIYCFSFNREHQKNVTEFTLYALKHVTQRQLLKPYANIGTLSACNSNPHYQSIQITSVNFNFVDQKYLKSFKIWCWRRMDKISWTDCVKNEKVQYYIESSRKGTSNIQQESQCAYKCNIEARSHNHCCCRKAINISYSECVSVALVIQHAMRMSCIIVYCHLWPVWLYHTFPHYLIKSTIF